MMVAQENRQHLFRRHTAAFANHPAHRPTVIGAVKEHVVQHLHRGHIAVTAVDKFEGDTFVEIGPGTALSGFVRKTLGASVNCYNIENVDGLEKTVDALKA